MCQHHVKTLISPQCLTALGGVGALGQPAVRTASYHGGVEPTLQAVQEGVALNVHAAHVARPGHVAAVRKASPLGTGVVSSDLERGVSGDPEAEEGSDRDSLLRRTSSSARRVTPRGASQSLGGPELQLRVRGLMQQISAIEQMTEEDLLDPLRSSKVSLVLIVTLVSTTAHLFRCQKQGILGPVDPGLHICLLTS